MENKLIISNFQAKKIAYCVYNDITNYIYKHSKEYKKWYKERRK